MRRFPEGDFTGSNASTNKSGMIYRLQRAPPEVPAEIDGTDGLCSGDPKRDRTSALEGYN